MSKHIAIMICTVFLSLPATAETKASPNTWKLEGDSPPASITEVAWIAGHWEGEAFGGAAEEVWLGPVDGSMVGLFRLSGKGKVSLYEMLTIREVGGTLRLELKHFGKDLVGWEEKGETVAFPLVSVEPGEVRFDEMTYRRVGQDGLEVWFTQGEGEKKTEHVFRGRRTRQ
jgi:hypothetical protein